MLTGYLLLGTTRLNMVMHDPGELEMHTAGRTFTHPAIPGAHISARGRLVRQVGQPWRAEFGDGYRARAEGVPVRLTPAQQAALDAFMIEHGSHWMRRKNAPEQVARVTLNSHNSRIANWEARLAQAALPGTDAEAQLQERTARIDAQIAELRAQITVLHQQMYQLNAERNSLQHWQMTDQTIERLTQDIAESRQITTRMQQFLNGDAPPVAPPVEATALTGVAGIGLASL